MNKEILERYLQEGWLTKQCHPSLPLTIVNYTEKTQFERFWDEITLKCRGLIIDDKYNIIAQPFPKFFNIEEETSPHSGNYVIEEKLDGSLGIAFWYANQWIFTSRGSFTSEQAFRGFQMFNKWKYGDVLDKKHTHCFEIIYPENRIVLDYGRERLVILASLENGKDVNICPAIKDRAKVFHFSDNIDNIKKYISNSEEGYVIRFDDGYRIKIKGDEYLRLHKICTNVSNRDILDYLINSKPIDELIHNVPDEFYNFVKSTICELNERHHFLLKNAYSERDRILKKLTNNYQRKDYAMQACNYINSQILFGIEDRKNISKMAWNIIKNNLEYKQPFRKIKDVEEQVHNQ